MKQRKIPQRKCITCQKSLAKREMVRIVRTPEGSVEIDFTGKKNGRGAYVCGRLDGFKLTRKHRTLDRALKTNISDETYDRLEQEFAHMNEQYKDVKCERNDQS
ncbi:MAG: nucleic-acid-binding protein [Paenibacillus sp. RIFOXYA1_FULL_44_5]|nr:MAG: nucleic-acid-binding protein [Paenibacillus sp. RIFOXYA1_FULL_44_5]